jgi:hypothetical protein
MVDKREVIGAWLHTIGVGCALMAALDAVVTYAAADQARPRVLALCLALLSALVLVVGWKRFKLMGRVDAVVLIGLDAWVFTSLAW